MSFNIVRIVEFGSLNVWWDTNAYGSVVWTLLGFHTAHMGDVLRRPYGFHGFWPVSRM